MISLPEHPSMVKAYQLRIGNLLIAADEQEPDSVIALEVGVVHLSRRTEPDDERNIFPYPLMENILHTLGFEKFSAARWIHAKHLFTVFEIEKRNNCYTLSFFDKTSSCYQPLSYAHEVQNVAYALFGKEIYMPDEIL